MKSVRGVRTYIYTSSVNRKKERVGEESVSTKVGVDSERKYVLPGGGEFLENPLTEVDTISNEIDRLSEKICCASYDTHKESLYTVNARE